MKVLHLISGGDAGGAKTHIINLLTELKKQKEVFPTLLCVLQGEFTDDVKAAGIPLVIIPQRKRYDIKAMLKIANFIKSESFDIVHCHGARANFIAIFVRLFIKSKMATTIHSDYLLDFKGSKYKQMFYTPLNKFAIKRFKNIVVITDNFKKMMISRGFKEKRLFTVYNGIKFSTDIKIIEKNAFLKKYNIKLNDNTVLIGNASRFHPVKGLDVFLKAAEIIVKHFKNQNSNKAGTAENIDIKFLIAGYGKEKQKYVNYINEKGLNENIFILGFVKEIDSFYNAIDINCLSSYSESFPYALLEGARQKCATVSSAAGGIVEMIKHRETGILFKIGDHEQLAKELITLIKDKSQRDYLGSNFYNDASQRFSSVRMAKTHVEIYERIMKEM